MKHLQKSMALITLPAGFTGTFGQEDHSWGAKPNLIEHYELTNGDNIRIRFGAGGDGHTHFKLPNGNWASFDRLGVEDSFYWMDTWGKDKGKVKNLNEIVTEQLAKIAAKLEYYKTAIKVPGLPGGGWTVAPDGVKKLQEQLAKSGHVTFVPSGFGTGYMVTKHMQRGCRHGEARAKPELEAFLGHKPLYVTTMDCD